MPSANAPNKHTRLPDWKYFSVCANISCERALASVALCSGANTLTWNHMSTSSSTASAISVFPRGKKW